MATNFARGDIEIRGVWDLDQARTIADALEDDFASRGLELKLIEVTVHQDPNRRVLIQVFCKAHQCAVAVNENCQICLAMEVK